MPRITDPNQLPSRTSLRRFANRGSTNSFLEFNAFKDVAFYLDDFDQDTINLDRYAVANSGGASAADFAVNITSGAVTGTGCIQGDTGTTDNGSCSMIGPIIYKGDNHCGMWIKLRSDVVTEFSFEVGFIDAVPGSNGPAFSAVAPTAVAANAAVIHMDTDEASSALDAMHLLTVGSTADQSAKATSLIGCTALNTIFMEATIQLVGDDVFASVVSNGTGGSAVASHNVRVGNNIAGFVEGGVALAPWVYIRNRSAATARFVDIDALATWTYRVAQ